MAVSVRNGRLRARARLTANSLKTSSSARSFSRLASFFVCSAKKSVCDPIQLQLTLSLLRSALEPYL